MRPAPSAAFRAELVMVGSELLLGQTVDTNAAYLARELARIGCDLYFKTTVGDNPVRMAEAFRLALARAGLVITSGGLGPTEDDLTREVAAQVMGRELVFDQRLMDQIEARLARRGLPVTPNNRKQAYLPAGAIPIENQRGSAPGFILEGEAGTIIALPGVPLELEWMTETAVIPYLKRRFGIAATIVSRTLKVSGMTESAVDQVVGDLIRGCTNPTVGILAAPGLVRLRLTAKAADEATARAMIEELETLVRGRLGEAVFGADDDTLEGVVGALLAERGLTVAVAETTAGGVIAQRFTQARVAPFRGGLVLPTGEAARIYLGLSDAEFIPLAAAPPALAEALASRVRETFEATVGLAQVGLPPGPRDPAGAAGRSYFCIATPQGTNPFEYGIGGVRPDEQARVGMIALDRLRRLLLRR
ncbi:MAG TPA: CinA family nicotinamide mononucleotide deamidase-related protein [Thermodesulfobacteriota bacterium]|nr:CinA family nicotinamide mononucleotide deamidase-related protein [Thermodesulfobacteriota bacterium]